MVNQTPRNPSSASDEDAFDAAQSREPADRSGEPDSASRKRLALKKPAAQDEPEGTREPRRGVRSRFQPGGLKPQRRTADEARPAGTDKPARARPSDARRGASAEAASARRPAERTGRTERDAVRGAGRVGRTDERRGEGRGRPREGFGERGERDERSRTPYGERREGVGRGRPESAPSGEERGRPPRRFDARGEGVRGDERRPRRDVPAEGGRRPFRDEAGASAPATPRGVYEPRREGKGAPRSTTGKPARPAPRAHLSADEGVRLSKLMAERGLCSRREADAIIERGWVFVDGKRVSELGIRVAPSAHIELAPEAEQRQARQVTILLHKPVGYVSGQPEEGYEAAVALIGPDNQFDRDTAQAFHHSHLRGLAPAGRLDIDSTGLLVLTQNGRIARQLIGENSDTEKEYLVRVEGALSDEGLKLLNHGLELDGHKLRPAKVEWLNEDQLRFRLREGRKRQIRRMCELVGLKVVGLKRVRIGKVRLGDLPLGEWRYLRDDEQF